MNLKKGFSIIEILVYLFISSLISIFLGYLALDIYKNTSQIYKNFDEYIQLTVAFNKMVDDLKNLNISTIKKINNNELVFRDKLQDFTFQIDSKKRLVKSSNRSTIFSNNMKQIKFTPDFKDNSLCGIYCYVEKNNFYLSKYIAFQT